MSRRSLYRHSARHSVQPYLTETDDNVVYWSKEWVTPTSTETATAIQPSNSGTPAPGAVSSTGSPAVNGTANSVTNGKPGLGFSVKMWTVVESSPPPTNDGDDEDLLDMTQFSVIKVEPEKPAPPQGGLSAADIRGAVGGESIPGIASYSTNNDTQDDNDQVNEVEADDQTSAREEVKEHKVPEEVERVVDESGTAATSMDHHTEQSLEQEVKEVVEQKVDQIVPKAEEEPVTVPETSSLDIEPSENIIEEPSSENRETSEAPLTSEVPGTDGTPAITETEDQDVSMQDV
jgi:hypothetical protein